jgi:uncharacterized protein affecting Mg2+/Co2+ transport
MVQQVTEGVNVMVETFYQAGQSNPLNSEYLFAEHKPCKVAEPALEYTGQQWYAQGSRG